VEVLPVECKKFLELCQSSLGGVCIWNSGEEREISRTSRMDCSLQPLSGVRDFKVATEIKIIRQIFLDFDSTAKFNLPRELWHRVSNRLRGAGQ